VKSTFAPIEAALLGLVVVATTVLAVTHSIDGAAALGLFSSVVGYLFRAVVGNRSPDGPQTPNP
jgi:hypothetical protein